MPEAHDGTDGVGNGASGDTTDDRIRSMLARAVASAPAPPAVDEVRVPGPTVVPVAPVRSGPGRQPGRRGQSSAASGLRAVAASIAMVMLALGGARAIGGLDDAGVGGSAAVPGGDLPVRYVPAEAPGGLSLTGIDVPAGPAPGPTPAVAVYERDDVTVRIALGPTDWAARAAGPAPTTTVPASTVPTTSPTATSTAPSSTTANTTETTLATTTTATPSTDTAPATAPPTTTVPPLDAASVPGIPGRPGIQATEVRGDAGGIEAHGPTTTTVWFLHQGELAAVDVDGLDPAGALGIVERLRSGRAGRLVPAPEDGLRRVAEAAPQPAGTPPPAAVRLVYSAPDSDRSAFVVTTTRLRSGTEDLFSATPGSFGRIERWGDRRVLVDDGLDGGTATLVSFVDPAGVLVAVRGPAGDAGALERYVDGLQPVDDLEWALFLADHADVVDRGDQVETGDQVDTDGGPEPSPTTGG